MGVQITCYDPATGQMQTIDASTVSQGGGGFGDSSIGPAAFGAQRINLCMYDVQQSIAEGRAAGNKPFNLYNSASPWESAQ
jgi:hypothetical protein